MMPDNGHRTRRAAATQMAPPVKDGTLEPRTAPRRQKRPSDAPDAVSDALSAVYGASKPRKYLNKPTQVDGFTFDSKREAERYLSLRQDERDGKISGLAVHPRFPLVIHGIDCGAYEGDFSYIDAAGLPVVEDVKSPATRKLPTYRLKRKQVWALYAIEIREV